VLIVPGDERKIEAWHAKDEHALTLPELPHDLLGTSILGVTPVDVNRPGQVLDRIDHGMDDVVSERYKGVPNAGGHIVIGRELSRPGEVRFI
jgi:hypothetical protein